jgi:hypothetical protein
VRKLVALLVLSLSVVACGDDAEEPTDQPYVDTSSRGSVSLDNGDGDMISRAVDGPGDSEIYFQEVNGYYCIIWEYGNSGGIWCDEDGPGL